jgi:hypothetical protein
MQETNHSSYSRFSHICGNYSRNNHGRFKLMAAFFTIGIISLIQPGCSCSSSSDGGDAPSSAIVSVSPQANSLNALVSNSVSAIFRDEMDAATINDTTFTLTRNGLPVPATVLYVSVNQTSTLSPSGDLLPDTEYRATISSSVKDVDDKFPLSVDYIWSFTASSAMYLTSKNSSGVVGNEASQNTDIDSSGRYIVFESNATNLDPSFTVSPGVPTQIYRKDTVSGEVLLVSAGSNGIADNNAVNPTISSNGRYVVFESTATNLDTTVLSPGTSQIYLKNLVDGSVNLISRSTTKEVDNGPGAKNARVSDDGQFVVFESAATNLVGIASGGFAQIYLKNVISESVVMISRTVSDIAGSANSTNPDMSADGRHIVFESAATNLNTSAGFKHIYYVDTGKAHVVETASVTSGGVDANADSNSPSVSDDGDSIAFHTVAANLDVTDTNGIDDVYVRNRVTASTRLVSVNSDDTGSGNGASANANISGDAKYIVFESLAENLILDDTNGIKDIFVRNLSVLSTDRVNNPSDGSESTFPINQAYQHLPVISSDGRYVGFNSEQKYTLDDTDTLSDVYRALNTTVQ